MLKLLKLAVTGGVASGKSTVCSFLQEFGAAVVNMDLVVYELLSQNNNCIQKVLSLLGNEVCADDGIDRKKVADIVFQFPEKLEQLERIVHPFVREEVRARYMHACGTNASAFVVEVPLLFETEDPSWYDASIAVVADEALAKKRFMAKSGGTSLEYDLRMRRQLSVDEKSRRATYTIRNNGTMQDLQENTRTLFYTLIT